MKAADRERNNLEKNADRLDKAREMVELTIKTNTLSDLDLFLVVQKLATAADVMRETATKIVN